MRFETAAFVFTVILLVVMTGSAGLSLTCYRIALRLTSKGYRPKQVTDWYGFTAWVWDTPVAQPNPKTLTLWEANKRERLIETQARLGVNSELLDEGVTKYKLGDFAKDA